MSDKSVKLTKKLFTPFKITACAPKEDFNVKLEQTMAEEAAASEAIQKICGSPWAKSFKATPVKYFISPENYTMCVTTKIKKVVCEKLNEPLSGYVSLGEKNKRRFISISDFTSLRLQYHHYVDVMSKLSRDYAVEIFLKSFECKRIPDIDDYIKYIDILKAKDMGEDGKYLIALIKLLFNTGADYCRANGINKVINKKQREEILQGILRHLEPKKE